ncbi:MAG: nitroreductase family deazaflavin-dependent oxidoreductase [Marmoricola sp.]
MATTRRDDGNLMPRWLPAINRRIVNPLQRMWAPYLPFYALIEHRGRVSGTAYRTPVLAFRRGSSLMVLLGYGDRTDWLRNIQAGPASVVKLGRRRSVTSVTVETNHRIRRAVLHLAD